MDDLFAQPVKPARPGGRFQPKAKLKPPKNNNTPATTNQNTDTQLIEPSPNNDDSTSSASLLPHEKDFSKDITNDSLHPNLDTTTQGQNADTFIHLDDLVTQSTTTDMEGSAPRSDAVPSHENTRGSDVPIISDSSYTNNVTEAPTYLRVLDERDLITTSRCDGGVSMNDKECEREEMSVMDSIDFSEFTTTPVQRTGKFQPKRKVQMQGEVPAISSMESGPNPPEINTFEKDSVPDTICDDDVLDFSSIGLNDGSPTEETYEPPLNEESMNLMEDVPEFPAKLVSRRAKIGTGDAHVASSDSGQQQNACSSGQDNETTDRVLRPRKKKVSFREPDEADFLELDDDLQISEFSDIHPASSAADEGDNCDDEQFEQESESKIKRKRRKSTKTDEDKEKQSKKQKRVKKASDGKPKKFSHSTRRRQVDKALLEIPEEEIDHTRLPLRDLIRLAEHREKQMIKEAATAQPATKESNGNSSASHYENETYASGEDEDEEDTNKQEPAAKVHDMNYFNYQTYMNKTPTIRWSKQETELFYEAMRQFGTDLSMIQHLFPGRTRRQIKLKYKKEEKQNPFRLHDALTTRTKDVSHFQKVIDRLKQIAAEEKQNADEDESMGGLSGDEAEEEEETSPTNDEEGKTEEIGKEEKEDVPEDVPEDVQETGNSEEQKSDGEDDSWLEYKSMM